MKKNSSPGARLLKDAAAEQEREVALIERVRVIMREGSARVRQQFGDFVRNCEVAMRWDSLHGESNRGASPVQSDADLFFVAEALRHVNNKLKGRDADLYLRGFARVLLQAEHPARMAVTTAYLKCGDRRDLIDLIQIGEYSWAS